MVTLKLPREKNDGSIGTEIGIAIGQVAGDGNSLIWADDPDNPDGLLLTLPDGTPRSRRHGRTPRTAKKETRAASSRL